MLKHILLFGGTEEGRKLAEFLASTSVPTTVSVATSYGEELLPEAENISVSCKRLDFDDMRNLIKKISADLIIDATHPYALIVSENIQKVCEQEKLPLIRIERKLISENELPANTFPSISEAVQFLQNTKGNILVTTGSKNLSDYTCLTNFTDRIYARVLPDINAISSCRNLGLSGSHILAMQGPFSVEMNIALIHHIHAVFLVTKNSGSTGGFSEKLTAAENCGISPVIIQAPSDIYEIENSGHTLFFEKGRKTITALFLKEALLQKNHIFSKLYGQTSDVISVLSSVLL